MVSQLEMLIGGHVAAAVLGLVLAPLAMAVRKGGTWHRRWGRIYFWAMVVVCASGLAILPFRPSPFLLFITLLSAYSVVTGFRVLRRKRPERGHGPTWLDWGATAVALAAAAGFLTWGASSLLESIATDRPLAFSILGLVFGAALAQSAFTDLLSYVRPSGDRNWWWYAHMERMLGSYIALLTALAVQITGRILPLDWQWVAWIAPAVIGSPLIGMWINCYRRRFAPRSGGERELPLQTQKPLAQRSA